MNNKDLLEAIGSTDEALLERTERNPSNMKRILLSATAACLVLAISTGLLLRKPQVSPTDRTLPTAAPQTLPTPDEPVDKINTSIPSAHQIAPEKVIGSNAGTAGNSPYSVTGIIHYSRGIEYQFIRAITVEARVLEVLPDFYSGYHILHLEILDVLIGSNVPQEVYYLLPGRLDPDLTQYDSLILNMKQRGLENSPIINSTQKQMETFTLLFGQDYYDPECGAVLAFTDGQLDPSLWDKEGWNDSTLGPLLVSGNSTAHMDCLSYPGKLDRNLEQTKQAILDQQKAMQGKLDRTDFTQVITSEFFDWPQAQETFRRIFSMEDGIYRQTLYIRVGTSSDYQQAEFTRMINGFPANQYIIVSRNIKDGITTESVTHSDIQFTQYDLENLPDIGGVLDNMEAYAPEKYQGDAFSQHYSGYQCRYEKQEDGSITGIILVFWHNYNQDTNKATLSEFTCIKLAQDGSYTTSTNPYKNITFFA